MDGRVSANDVATLGLVNGGYGIGNRGVAPGYGYNVSDKVRDIVHGSEQNQTAFFLGRDQSKTAAELDCLGNTIISNQNEDRFSRSVAASQSGFDRLSAQMNADAMRAAECCCETKLLIAQQNEKTRDLIRDEKIADLRANNAVLSNELSNARQTSELEALRSRMNIIDSNINIIASRIG